MHKICLLRTVAASFTMILLFACTNSENKKLNKIQDVKAVCEKYAIHLETDSLKDAADAYMLLAKPYTWDYYKARHFQLLVDFNAHNYDKVLESISQIKTFPHFNEFTGLKVRYLYTQARAYQYTQKYKEAIQLFDSCLTFNSNKDSVREVIRSVAVEAMLQMMNTYLVSGDYEGCVQYFRKLLQHPTPIVRKYAMRDLYSMSAYAISRTDSVKEAENYMFKALSMPLYKSTPQRLFRDYSYAASIFSLDSKKQELSISLCKKALHIYSGNNNIAGAQWLISLLGSLYLQTGNIWASIHLYQYSVNLSKSKNDLNGEAEAYKQLTDLYNYLDLYEQADVWASISLKRNLEQKDHNPLMCGSSYNMKGRVMMAMNKEKEAIYYFTKADSCLNKLPYQEGQAQIDESMGDILINKSSMADYKAGVFRLRRAVSNPSNDSFKANVFFLLAKGMISHNNSKEGEAMLDSMYNVIHSFDTPIYIDGANKFALQYYLSKGNTAKIARYAAAYLKETNIRYNRQLTKSISQMTVKIETQKEKQQLLLTQSELRNKELNIRVFIIICIALLILLGFCVWLFIYKRKIYKLRHELTEQHLESLSAQLDSQTGHLQKAKEELSELLSDINNHQQIEAITPNMYRKDGEAKFRSRFTQLYPSFLSNLKAKVPTITRSEEVLCMLIVLNQTPEQMVDILCIARSSINMSRHRLRQRMQLERDESLESFINSLI